MDDDITLRKATAQTLQESERFEEAAALWRGILLNSQTDVDALLGLAVTTTYLHDCPPLARRGTLAAARRPITCNPKEFQP